jgi:hypothetical protein
MPRCAAVSVYALQGAGVEARAYASLIAIAT